MTRDLSFDDQDGWLSHSLQERSWDRFADRRVSKFEQEEEGYELGLAGWFVVALLLAGICAITGMWMAS